jgi:hypothetical protein
MAKKMDGTQERPNAGLNKMERKRQGKEQTPSLLSSNGSNSKKFLTVF